MRHIYYNVVPKRNQPILHGQLLWKCLLHYFYVTRREKVNIFYPPSKTILNRILFYFIVASFIYLFYSCIHYFPWFLYLSFLFLFLISPFSIFIFLRRLYLFILSIIYLFVSIFLPLHPSSSFSPASYRLLYSCPDFDVVERLLVGRTRACRDLYPRDHSNQTKIVVNSRSKTY